MSWTWTLNAFLLLLTGANLFIGLSQYTTVALLLCYAGYYVLSSCSPHAHLEGMLKINPKTFKALGKRLGNSINVLRIPEVKENRITISTKDGKGVLEGAIRMGEKSCDVGIIITHPWGRLGGNMNFPLVEKLSRLFGALGFTVCRFNFRGVGGSRGGASFNGSHEENDLVSVAEHMLSLHADQPGSPQVKRLIFIGYSYGSMIASAVGGRLSSVKGYVAISYPFTFNWALAIGNSKRLIEEAKGVKPKLFLMGGRDEFTSETSFIKLVSQIDNKADGMVIQGEGHHWIGKELCVAEAIIQWMATRFTRLPTAFTNSCTAK